MEREEIMENLRTALAKVLDVVPANLGPESRLREDVGLDSFAALELLFELEDRVGIKIPQADVMGLRTVDDVVLYVQRAQSGTLPPPPEVAKVTGA
jgi:acyl carrier protein